MSPPNVLPVPDPGREVAEAWVARYLSEVVEGSQGSTRFVGGQAAADAALDAFDVTGYAKRRNEAYPMARRGASGLSPYIRHGLLTLPEVWDAVAGGPSGDVRRFRDELLWQEYARHLYARLGPALARPLRRRPAQVQPLPNPTPVTGADHDDGAGPAAGVDQVDGADQDDGPDQDEAMSAPWDPAMACLELTIGELEDDGWLVNQTRMWLASHWAVRLGHDWRDGEDYFFRHLLDGSRAANRLGWQWTSGVGSNRPYGFSRWQVERRAPGLCADCPSNTACPIDTWPDDPAWVDVDRDPRLRRDPDPARTAGPTEVYLADGPTAGREPEAVWLTAESLGMSDPALVAHPELPAVFVFDRPLLARLRLSAKRLVFLVETLAELAQERSLDLLVGDPVEMLQGRPVATTFAPVPGWRTRSSAIGPVAVYPWPWLRQPGPGPIASFSAWVRNVDLSLTST